jgi:hypothetical protein
VFSFTVSTNTSTYYIGICALPDHPIGSGAIIQQEKNASSVSYVLGQLNRANLVGGG